MRIKLLAACVGLALAAPAWAGTELIARTTYRYDELGRRVAEMDAEGREVNTYTYDNEGNLLTRRDAVGRTTTLTYDALNRMASSRDHANGTVTLTYDGDGRVREIQDGAGLTTRYRHDGFGQLWRLESPDIGVTTFEYASSGLRTRMVRNDGSAVTYAHDGAGRLVTATSDGSERRYHYDTCDHGLGRMCLAEALDGGNLTSAVSYQYAAEGWIEARRDAGIDVAGAAFDHLTAYAHDGLGRLTGIAYPSGISVGYGYSGAQLALMTATVGGTTHTVASTMTYQPGDRRSSLLYGNGLERRYTFDRNGQLTGLSSGTGTEIVQSLTYGFNVAGDRTAITNGVQVGVSQTYTYDGAGRLATQQLAAGALQEFTYDLNGNKLQHTGPWNETLALQPGSNRVTQMGDQLFSHDARGNRQSHAVAGSTATYVYDGFNRLRSYSRDLAASSNEPNGTGESLPLPAGTWQYAYDALDQRSSKTAASGATRFVHGERDKLLGESTGGQWRSYLWLGNELIAMVVGGQLRFVHSDHAGRPEAVTNQARQVVWRAANFGFNRSVLTDQVGGLNLGFPGQYRDAESGLWHNGYRDYDSRLGRYIQPDPTGVRGGMNLYGYAGSNPVAKVDPFGLTQADIDCLWEMAKKVEKDLEFPSGQPIVEDLGPKVAGEYNHFSRNLYIDDDYLAELAPWQLVSLYDTIVHEVLHRDRGYFSGFGQGHKDVYAEANKRSAAQKSNIESGGACDCP
ncbi:RHS repeat domain-containing protein [Lysobacter soli]|uniref:RHS repeat domain-containing protein n=1 Tax=Lysobacter soli TaxID=453783 RepID=UPI00369F02A6